MRWVWCGGSGEGVAEGGRGREGGGSNGGEGGDRRRRVGSRGEGERDLDGVRSARVWVGGERPER